MGKSENKYGQQGQWEWEGKEPGAGWDVRVTIQLNKKKRYPEGIQIFRKEFLVSDQDLGFIQRLRQIIYEVRMCLPQVRMRVSIKTKDVPGMVAHILNPGTQEADR